VGIVIKYKYNLNIPAFFLLLIFLFLYYIYYILLFLLALFLLIKLILLPPLNLSYVSLMCYNPYYNFLLSYLLHIVISYMDQVLSSNFFNIYYPYSGIFLSSPLANLGLSLPVSPTLSPMSSLLFFLNPSQLFHCTMIALN
jgi:hypothetical protein